MNYHKKTKTNESSFPKEEIGHLSKYLEHTIIKADTSEEEIKILCAEAIEYGIVSICISPYFVRQVSRFLEGTNIKIATVVGFPMGYSSTAAKVEEIKRAFIDGADEIDAVVNLNAIKSGNWSYVENDIVTLTQMTSMKDKAIKIIFEVDLLNESEALKLCEICNCTEVDYVKLSTGINSKGNNPSIVQFLKQHLSDSIDVIAAGGIETSKEARLLLEAGAKRIASSKSIKIIKDAL